MKYTEEELKDLSQEMAIAIIKKFLISNDALAIARYEKHLTNLILKYLERFKSCSRKLVYAI